MTWHAFATNQISSQEKKVLVVGGRPKGKVCKNNKKQVTISLSLHSELHSVIFLCMFIIMTLLLLCILRANNVLLDRWTIKTALFSLFHPFSTSTITIPRNNHHHNISSTIQHALLCDELCAIFLFYLVEWVVSGIWCFCYRITTGSKKIKGVIKTMWLWLSISLTKSSFFLTGDFYS